MWYRFWQIMVRLVFPVCFRIRAFGRDNIPKEGPVILVCNHQSYIDPLAVGGAVDRPVSYMARKSLFSQSAPFAWLLRSANAFPVDKDGRGSGAIRETIRRLRKDDVVLVFPEGTRTHTGEIGEFMPGIFLMASRMGVPVVPTAIEGAFEAWPRGGVLPRLSTVQVRFGEAVRSEEFEGEVERMRQRCREAIVQMQAWLQTAGEGARR